MSIKKTCFGNAPLLEEVKKKLGLVIKDGAITTNKIKDGAVTESKIADGALSTGKIKDGAITTDKIADKAVTEKKLADGAVTTNKIVDKNVTTEKLADGVITTEKIKDGSITPSKISNSLYEIILNGGTKKWVIPVWDLGNYPNSLDEYDGSLGDPANLLTVGDYVKQGNYLYKYEGENAFTEQSLEGDDFKNALFLDLAEVGSFEPIQVTELYKLYTYFKGNFVEVSACDLTFEYVDI